MGFFLELLSVSCPCESPSSGEGCIISVFVYRTPLCTYPQFFQEYLLEDHRKLKMHGPQLEKCLSVGTNELNFSR